MIDVAVLRVFTDDQGRFGNPLGVVDAAAVAPADRQALATELGYSETVFVTLPTSGATTAEVAIFTPGTELPFAGHPTVGAAWWLRDRGTPVTALQAPAGALAVSHPDGLTAVTARREWAPEFVFHEMKSAAAVQAASPSDYPADAAHYVWAWTDESGGALRSRMFAVNLGVPEDEATGAAAVRATAHLGRDLDITQGAGSRIVTTWDPRGWVTVAGRVVRDDARRV